MNCSEVLRANKWLVDKELCILTWGNVSYLDRDESILYIKPSGANLDELSPKQISQVSYETNELLGGLSPSVDTPTHLELYKQFGSRHQVPYGVNSIVHTHSVYATAFAQAGSPIPCLGTTHADYFFGEIPCVPQPTEEEVEEDYEKNTGKCIANYFISNGINPMEVPAALVQGHGVFCWGKTIEDALEISMIVEKVAQMASITLSMLPLRTCGGLSPYLLKKHYLRKHGTNNYYGQ